MMKTKMYTHQYYLDTFSVEKAFRAEQIFVETTAEHDPTARYVSAVLSISGVISANALKKCMNMEFINTAGETLLFNSIIIHTDELVELEYAVPFASNAPAAYMIVGVPGLKVNSEILNHLAA